jgi:methionyl-tRNA synthetase
MATSYVDGVTPDAREDGPLVEQSRVAFEKLTDGIAALDFSGGYAALWQLIKDANAYIEERQPWALNKAGDIDAVAAVLGDCLEALRIVALLASPVIPHAAAELWRRLGLAGAPEDQRLPGAAAWGSAPTAGNALDKGTALFPRLDAE